MGVCYQELEQRMTYSHTFDVSEDFLPTPAKTKKKKKKGDKRDRRRCGILCGKLHPSVRRTLALLVHSLSPRTHTLSHARTTCLTTSCVGLNKNWQDLPNCTYELPWLLDTGCTSRSFRLCGIERASQCTQAVDWAYRPPLRRCKYLFLHRAITVCLFFSSPASSCFAARNRCRLRERASHQCPEYRRSYGKCTW